MSKPVPIADPDVLELVVERETVAHIESRSLAECSASDAATLAHTLRTLADMIERDHLEAPASEVLREEDPTFSLARGHADRQQIEAEPSL